MDDYNFDDSYSKYYIDITWQELEIIVHRLWLSKYHKITTKKMFRQYKEILEKETMSDYIELRITEFEFQIIYYIIRYRENDIRSKRLFFMLHGIKCMNNTEDLQLKGY